MRPFMSFGCCALLQLPLEPLKPLDAPVRTVVERLLDRRAFMNARFDEFILEVFVVMPDVVHTVVLSIGGQEWSISDALGKHEEETFVDVEAGVRAFDRICGSCSTGAVEVVVGAGGGTELVEVAVVAHTFDFRSAIDLTPVDAARIGADFGIEPAHPSLLPRARRSLRRMMDDLPGYANRAAFSRETSDLGEMLHRLSCTYNFWLLSHEGPCLLLP
jgi:hypothetical protein